MSSTNSSNSTNSGSSSGSHSTSSNEQGVIVHFAPRRTRSASNANANANVAKSNGLVLSTNLRPRTSSSLSAAAASAGAASDEPPKKKRKKKKNNDGPEFPAIQLSDRNLNTVNDKIMDRTKERRAILEERQKSSNVRFGYSPIVIMKEDCSHVISRILSLLFSCSLSSKQLERETTHSHNNTSRHIMMSEELYLEI